MKGQKLREAKVAAPQERLNPHVLRQLLYEIVESEFSGDRAAAAAALELTKPSKGITRPFTKDILSNVIEDRTALKYTHLEAVANFYNVPTFVLLLFSRLRSEHEKSPGKDIGDVTEVQFLTRFLQDIEMTIECCAFGPNDLKWWSKKYNELRLL